MKLMKTSIIILLLNLLSLSSFSQSLDLRKSLYKDADGKYYVDSTGVLYTGFAYAKYKGGEKGMEGVINKGVFDKLWTWWYADGSIKRETLFSDGKKNGYSYWWYRNGVKMMEVEYYNNKNVSQKRWDPKGIEKPNPRF